MYERGTILKEYNSIYQLRVLGEVLDPDCKPTGIIVLQRENLLNHQLSRELYISKELLDSIKTLIEVKPSHNFRKYGYFSGLSMEFLSFRNDSVIHNTYMITSNDEGISITKYNSDVDEIRLLIKNVSSTADTWVTISKNSEDLYSCILNQLLKGRLGVSDFVMKFIASRDWFNHSLFK